MRLRHGGWILGVLVALIVMGVGVREYKRSVVDPKMRFNLLFVDLQGERVSLASFDPVEQKIIVIEYPPELTITSRSVGTYVMRNLYTLGAYKGGGGEFARRKVQGFMKLPIVGYLVAQTDKEKGIEQALRESLGRSIVKRGTESNLSYWDHIRLYHLVSRASIRVVGKEELLRAGVLIASQESRWSYNSERLNHYVGATLFDWSVGQEGATVAIINESGIDGMGSDMASFLTSMGLDVVMVKSGNEISEKTRYVVEEPERFLRALRLIDRVFAFEPYTTASTQEYRADMVFWIGKDTLELF